MHAMIAGPYISREKADIPLLELWNDLSRSRTQAWQVT